MNKKYPEWTEEDVTTLKHMLKNGVTYNSIAAFFNVSVGVVNYRCEKLGVKSRNVGGHKIRFNHAPDPKSPVAVSHILHDDEPRPIGSVNTFPDADTYSCRFIRSDVSQPNWRCCGLPAYGNWPYCDYHGKLAYQNWKHIKNCKHVKQEKKQ